MTQDTIHYVSTPEPADAVATPHVTAQADSLSRPAIRHIASADTIPPDPSLLMPLPFNEPLTIVPRMLEGDYWAEGLVHIEKSELAQQLDSVSGIRGKVTSFQPTGMAGDPVPYQFKTDNFVTISLMVSFFLVVWVISRSRHFLHSRVKDFFHTRHHASLFAEQTQNELRGQLFLIFQTCFVQGILYFDFTQEHQTEVFNQVSPYQILGTGVGICCLYYLFKMAVYSFVNSVFFSRRQRTDWSETYLLCVLGLGLALFPVALLVVYFDLSFHTMSWLFLCILLLDKSLLFYKCYRTFFNSPLGLVHLFLYFCTLEIMPLLILFRALIYANNFLLTIN